MGEMHSCTLQGLAKRLPLWADRVLLSIQAVHLLCSLNRGADMLSREGIVHGEWRLHPQTVRLIWSLWRSGDQPFCIGRERPLSALLLTDSCYPERGCAVEPLAQRSEICIPPSQNNAASAAKNQRGEGCCASGNAEMAQPTIVSRVGKPVGILKQSWC